MTYRRVIPRDLFNEANLLKCLGMLWIALEGTQGHCAALDHADGHIFAVIQDPDDGSISCSTVTLTIRDQITPLFRPLNSRDPYPLWARFGDLLGDYEDIEVFNIEGHLSAEFLAKIAQPQGELA